MRRAGTRRNRPLPSYPDASRDWHYHVVCVACHPKGTSLAAGLVVQTRREALPLARRLNAESGGQQHRFVLQGCALACRIPGADA